MVAVVVAVGAETRPHAASAFSFGAHSLRLSADKPAWLACLPACRLPGTGVTAGSPTQRAEPEWVDWASVRRGQEHWKRLLGPTFVALNAALLQGFTIARFAEVLVIAG
jgi:hypothetical protein